MGLRVIDKLGSGGVWDRVLYIILALAILGALGALVYAIVSPKEGGDSPSFIS